MARERRCSACGDPIEDNWWTKAEYMMEAGQIALAARYCEECGREKVLGYLESPRSERSRMLGDGWQELGEESGTD